MDDQIFDNIIKGKVSEYIDPVYDESALAGLHQKLAGAYSPPWYSQYKGAGMMAAVFAVFTIINWMMLSSYDEAGGERLDTGSVTEHADFTGAVKELRYEISKLRAAN